MLERGGPRSVTEVSLSEGSASGINLLRTANREVRNAWENRAPPARNERNVTAHPPPPGSLLMERCEKLGYASERM
jgi:hypothetical protein